MKLRVKAEISCDEHGYPTYQEEDIECKTAFCMYGITVADIGDKDGILIMGVKEHFKIDTRNGFSTIDKKEFKSSKRVGKYALNRCFNCEKADNCKWLEGDTVLIRHGAIGVI